MVCAANGRQSMVGLLAGKEPRARAGFGRHSSSRLLVLPILLAVLETSPEPEPE